MRTEPAEANDASAEALRAGRAASIRTMPAASAPALASTSSLPVASSVPSA